MRNLEIPVGAVFGRLTVIGPAISTAHHRRIPVVCACGELLAPAATGLRRGNNRSCGCLKLEKSIARILLARKPKKYPAGSERSVGVWKQMLDRCSNPQNKFWHRYGGRGIAVSESWLNFDSFYADMGTAPKGYHLDRIDNDGPYCKENCKWVTVADSLKNRSLTLWVTYQGEKLSLKELSVRLGIPYDPIYRRYASMRGNIDMEKLTKPLAKRRKKDAQVATDKCD